MLFAHIYLCCNSETLVSDKKELEPLAFSLSPGGIHEGTGGLKKDRGGQRGSLGRFFILKIFGAC